MDDEKLIELQTASALADGDLFYVVQDPDSENPLDRKTPTASLRGSMVVPVTEVPTGSIDGSNGSYFLTGLPRAGSLTVFKNGLMQDISPFGDLTVVNNIITFNVDAVPLPGDQLKAMYFK
jgi:hypothetical protein